MLTFRMWRHGVALPRTVWRLLVVLGRAGMFGLLRYDRKANGKEPERQNERTLEHGRIQNQIAANASEFFRKATN